MAGLQKTIQVAIPSGNRADFNRSDYETLIAEKGRRVSLATSIVCPCKDKTSNQQSNCKNCGGTGWVFYNERETRMVIKGMSAKEEFLPNGSSITVTGDISISASNTEELTAMDRLTIEDSVAIFAEVLFMKIKGSVKFAYTAYNIKEISYIGLFKGIDQPLQRLVQDVDYTYERNIIKIINPLIVPVQGEISVSVRYKHAPQYHIIDMKRESMETFTIEKGYEDLKHLPVSATARRAHYILAANNLAGDRLIDNSF